MFLSLPSPSLGQTEILKQANIQKGNYVVFSGMVTSNFIMLHIDVPKHIPNFL